MTYVILLSEWFATQGSIFDVHNLFQSDVLFEIMARKLSM